MTQLQNSKQYTLIENIENGGLKLCHVETKVKALRLSWLKCLTSESQSNYKILPRVFYKCSNLHTYFDANHKVLNTNTIPSVYTEIHKVYMSLFKQEPINTTEILDQSLWLNQNISINNKYVYFFKSGKAREFHILDTS